MDEFEAITAFPAEYSVQDFELGPLKATDSCDRCSASAQARVVRRENGVIVAELLFCGHHLNRFAEPLTDQGFTVT